MSLIFFGPFVPASAGFAKRFREVAAFPYKFSDFAEHDSAGRRVGAHIYGKFANKFWDDFADRHVKILDVHFADRTR